MSRPLRSVRLRFFCSFRSISRRPSFSSESNLKEIHALFAAPTDFSICVVCVLQREISQPLGGCWDSFGVTSGSMS